MAGLAHEHGAPVLGAAASILCAPLLDAAPQRLTVAHRGRLAWQLVDRDARAVVCLVTGAAVRLPHAVVVPLLPRRQAPILVGHGLLEWDGTRFPVTRWWTPARPRLPWLRERVDERAATRLVRGWRSGIGRGEGLTPYGDDVLCGSLVALHAAGHPASADLSRELHSSRLEQQTTATSAALLRLAADGWCVDELADHLTALARGSQAASGVLKVGHSSGRGLLEGVSRVIAPTVARVAA